MRLAISVRRGGRGFGFGPRISPDAVRPIHEEVQMTPCLRPARLPA
jgi:hypothetical protein